MSLGERWYCNLCGVELADGRPSRCSCRGPERRVLFVDPLVREAGRKPKVPRQPMHEAWVFPIGVVAIAASMALAHLMRMVWP